MTQDIKEKYSVNVLSLRPFGILAGDLDVDFGRKAHPFLVTQILRFCARDENEEIPDENLFWDMTIGKRIECLFAIAASGGALELSVTFHCRNETCRKLIEVGISQEDITSAQSENNRADTIVVKSGDESLTIRKPRGRDQVEWLKASYVDKGEALKGMISALVHTGEKEPSDSEYPLSDEWIQKINDSMGEFDPLVNFCLMVRCPYCEEENRHEMDLEEILLNRLHREQMGLLDSIHSLACHYHWSEKQIFSIPPWRRRHYLSLLDKRENR